MRIIMLLLVLVITESVSGQKIDTTENLSAQELHDKFMKKRKVNRNTGWILLGTGLTATILGSSINVSQGWGEENKSKGVGLVYVGVGAMLGSIPAFISAGSNKRKARLALKNETIFNRRGPYKASQPSLALSIQL